MLSEDTTSMETTTSKNIMPSLFTARIKLLATL